MLFSVNYLSVTLWVLAGILVLIAIGLIIWRMTPHGKKQTKNASTGKVGSVSKDMNQLVLSMNSIYDYKIVFNALVKNRFAKSNHSLIPAVIAHDGNIFLLTNSIKVKKDDITINDIIDPYLNDKNRTTLDGFKMSWYREIERYVKSINEDVNIVKIIPVVGDNSKIKNLSSYNNVDIQEIGEWIKNYKSNQNLLRDFEEDDLLQKINKDNLMAKRALPKDKLRRLVD